MPLIYHTGHSQYVRPIARAQPFRALHQMRRRYSAIADILKLSFAAFGVQAVNGPLSDRFGRRSVLWLMTLVLVIGLVIEMIARTWWHWLISKVFMGLGQGMCQHGVLTVSRDPTGHAIHR